MSKKGNILKPIFLIAVVAIFFVFFLNYKNKEEIKLLENELKDYISLPVNIDGKIYKIERGRVLENEHLSFFKEIQVLRIAYNSTLNRFDPIFAIEGTDYEKMKSSVESLESSLEDITLSFDVNDRGIIKKYFYPIDFLKSLNETEKIRQKLIYYPDHNVADEYYESLEKTIDLYIEYTGNLANSLEKMDKVLGERPLVYLGIMNTKKIYIDGLRKLKNDIENKKKEIVIRKNCLNFFNKKCPSLKIAFQNITDNSDVVDYKYEKIPENIFYNKNIIVKASEELFVNNIRSNHDFPIIALRDSSCFRDFETTYYQPMQLYSDQKNNGFRPNLLNDIYFTPIKNNPADYIAKLEKYGLKYMYKPITNLYMCQIISKDFSRVITAETISKMPISEISSKKESDIFLKNNVLYESDVSKYVGEIKSRLKKEGELKLSESIGTNEVLYAEKIISISNQKHPRFDETIMDVIFVNSIVDPEYKIGRRLNPEFLFLTRGYSLTLLLGYNRTFLKEPPIFFYYQDLKTSFNALKIVSYNENLKKTYNAEKIVKEIVYSMNLLSQNHNPQ